jgi:hypothetical protein
MDGMLLISSYFSEFKGAFRAQKEGCMKERQVSSLKKVTHTLSTLDTSIQTVSVENTHR